MTARRRLFSRKPKPTQETRKEPPITRQAELPKVENDMVVTIDYTIKDDGGKVLDTTEGQAEFSYMHGGKGLIPSIQKGLAGKHAGDSINLRLLPKDGYGMHDPDATQDIEPPLFYSSDERDPEPEFEEGMQFEISIENELRLVTVKHVDETVITVDLNHPLAGKTLQVAATVKQVRPASEIEKKNQEII